LAAPSVGYARISEDSTGSLAGLAIFGFTQNKVLVGEVGVPAIPLFASGRIYAEHTATVNTGLAIANPNDSPASILFFFTDDSGRNFGDGTTTIAPNGQIARFLNESPFNGSGFSAATFTFLSSIPVSAIGLRGFTNERSEFLLTSLPVAALSPTSSQPTTFPHFADGGGWTTQLVLLNPTDLMLNGTVQFFDQGTSTVAAGQTAISVNGRTANTFPYTISPRSFFSLRSDGTGSSTQSGSIRIVPGSATATPSGLAIFAFNNGGVTVTQAGVPNIPSDMYFRMYAEASGEPGERGSIQTAIAIANPSPRDASIRLELKSLTDYAFGSSATSAMVTVPAKGQRAFFINQIEGFQQVPTPFQGVLRVVVVSNDPVSLLGIRARYNERGDFLVTTTPPVAEEYYDKPRTQLIFPHFVMGGGYTTQFIVFGMFPQLTTRASLQFQSQLGLPMDITLH
jgi:hypothetical protein